MKIKNLCASYGEAQVLHDMNMDFTGNSVSIVGRNGMGKTTLCYALTGMGPRVSGEIVWEGRNLVGMNPTQIAKSGIAIVPQGRRVFPSLTVLEHLRLIERRDMKWTIERVLALFPRLAERLENRANQLSGGEQQMLSIARALMRDPRLVIMDEPSEGLAPVIVQTLIKTLRQLAHEGIQLILVEQNLRVATAVSPHIAVLVSGKVALETSAAALLADEHLQSTYLGVGH